MRHFRVLALEAPFSKTRDRMTDSDRTGNGEVTLSGSGAQNSRGRGTTAKKLEATGRRLLALW